MGSEKTAQSDPGTPAYEQARAVLVGELRRIGASDSRNGFTDLANDVANGDPADIPSWVAMQLLASASAVPSEAADDLAWLSDQRRLTLDHYSPMYGDDDDQSFEWRVTREGGSINDREWEIVGRGETAAEAIAAARAMLAPSPTNPLNPEMG